MIIDNTIEIFQFGRTQAVLFCHGGMPKKKSKFRVPAGMQYNLYEKAGDFGMGTKAKQADYINGKFPPPVDEIREGQKSINYELSRGMNDFPYLKSDWYQAQILQGRCDLIVLLPGKEANLQYVLEAVASQGYKKIHALHCRVNNDFNVADVKVSGPL